MRKWKMLEIARAEATSQEKSFGPKHNVKITTITFLELKFNSTLKSSL